MEVQKILNFRAYMERRLKWKIYIHKVKMKLFSLLVMMCVIGYVSTTHECRGFQPNDYLQTGTIEFQNQDYFELECYEVAIKY